MQILCVGKLSGQASAHGERKPNQQQATLTLSKQFTAEGRTMGMSGHAGAGVYLCRHFVC